MRNKPVCTNNLALVNRKHCLSESIRLDQLVPVGDGNVLMDRQAATLLNKLLHDIGGWTQIMAVSGWRSVEEQQVIQETALRDHGEAYTKGFVAEPGYSEHQTGLAIDLGLRMETIDFICPEFPYTGIAQTFRNRAAHYGFIQRYLSGKEHITGIAHEPWHFRYVGVPHAEIITNLGVVLEEYIELLRQYPVGQRPFVFQSKQYTFELSYLSREEKKTEVVEETAALFSSDNCGGLIRTMWKNRES